MEVHAAEERISRFSLGTENFLIELNCDAPQPQLPYSTHFGFLRKQLEASWKTSFEKHACYLQSGVQCGTRATTNYFELVDKILCKLWQSQGQSCFAKIIRIESSSEELIISVTDESFSLLEVLKFCPGRLNNERNLLFVLFQVIEATFRLHQSGLPHLGLKLSNLYMDQNYRCVLGVPDLSELSNSRNSGLRCKVTADVASDRSDVQDENRKPSELARMTMRWVLRQCSNYDYLMYLNRLAGRTKGDPINSAILPWVTDFTSPRAGLRDLTKSKYHLTKGEAQLDANYQAFIHEHRRLAGESGDHLPMIRSVDRAGTRYEDRMRELIGAGNAINLDAGVANEPVNYCPKSVTINPSSNPDGRLSDVFQPHHLLDMMPNLAYYTYMARRTPKHILTRFVRPVYQPNEFPPNMARLYELTPEECIPEFFTDPSVFRSIHPDMPDLGLPPWCADPAEFIAYHVSVLESDAVSAMLHHWIDLTFGYKLIGDAAVRSKNVHLELAGSQDTLRRSGITCLFRTPHPRRWVPSVHSGAYFGPLFPHIRSDIQKQSEARNLNPGKQKQEHDGREVSFNPSTETVAHSSKPSSELRIDSDSETPIEQVSNNRTSIGSANSDSCHKSALLSLPSDYDPLALIRTYEGLCRFLAAETRHPDGFELPPFPVVPDQRIISLTDLFARDIEAIACLTVELFTHSVANYTEADCWSHAERFAFAAQMLRLHRDRIPRCLHRGLDLILGPIRSQNLHSINTGYQSAPFRPSAWHLLNLLFEFPAYFWDLHQVIQWLSQLTPDKADPSATLLARPLWGPLSVAVLGAYYPSPSLSHVTEPFQIDEQVLSMLYPHMQSAAEKQPGWLLLAVQSNALWAFFYAVGGTQAVERYLVPLLLRLYRADYTSRLAQGAQHPLSALCARRFLRLVLAYVRLDTFLIHVAPRVIHVLLTPSISSILPLDSDSPAEPTPASASVPPSLSGLEDRTGTAWFTACDPDASTVPPTMPTQADRGPSQSLSSLIDEIGLDLRSVDTEDELLDLILDQPRPFHDSSSSIYSSRLSTKSHESAGVRFSVDVAAGDSPLIEHRSACPTSTQPTDDSSERRANARHSTNSDPAPLNDTPSKQLPQNTIPPVVASTDSVIWLAKRVGPLITAQTLVRYLLAGLTACYEGGSQLSVLLPSPEGLSPTQKSYLPMPVQATNRPLVGDRSSAACLRCLEQLVCVYGIPFVQHVYMPFVNQSISRALTSNVGTTEPRDSSAESTAVWDAHVLARVVAALTFMQQFVTYLPDSYLSDNLQDSTLPDLLIQAIRLAGRHDVTFPAGASGRRALLYKIVDCVYVIGLRIGFELTRARFTSLFQLFFAMFDRVPLVESYPTESGSHQRSDSSSTCVDLEVIQSATVQSVSCEKPGPNVEQPHALHQQEKDELETENPTRRISTALKPAVLHELRQTFDSDLARLAYVPFCRLAGGVYIDTCLYNAEWIHTLIGNRPGSPSGQPVSCSLPSSESAFHVHKPRGGLSAVDNQSLSNFIPTNATTGQFGYNAREELNLIASSALYNDGIFHLRGAWSEVFQRELNERNDPGPRNYRFHGIRVASFVGHTARINSVDVFSNESSFLTTSHDKTVQLWSVSDSYNPSYLASEPVSLKGLSSNPASATNVHGLLLLSSATGRNTPTGPTSQSLLARLVYREHRRPVFGAIYLPTYRLVASTDGQLILWDPCTGQKVHSGLSDQQSVTALARCHIPGGAVLCADQNASVYLVDPRMPGSGEQRCALQLASGASLAPVVFARDRLKSTVTSTIPHRQGKDVDGDDDDDGNTHRGITWSLGDTLSSQLKHLALELDPRLTGPCLPAPSVASASGSAGSLRQLAQDAHSPLVFCGFSSGFATVLDLRNGQLMHAWRAHSDCVVQVSDWTTAWFVSSGDRSLAFWHLTRSNGRMESIRTLDHCVPRMVDLDGSDPNLIPGMIGITQFARYGDQLVVCGPGSTSSMGSAECSSTAQSGPTKTTQTSSSGNSSSTTTSGANLLGVYRPTPTGRPGYTALGSISSGLLRGRVTVLSSLPESGLILTGSTHGHVALMY